MMHIAYAEQSEAPAFSVIGMQTLFEAPPPLFLSYPLETREKSGDSTDVKIHPITGYRITIDVIGMFYLKVRLSAHAS